MTCPLDSEEAAGGAARVHGHVEHMGLPAGDEGLMPFVADAVENGENQREHEPAAVGYFQFSKSPPE